MLIRVRELALNLRRHGRHLVAQAQVQRQVRTQTPIILYIAAEEGLAIPRSVSNRGKQCAVNVSRLVGEEISQ